MTSSLGSNVIHEAIEGHITWLNGVSHVDIPSPWPASVDIRIRSASIGIVPQGVVGAVPLLNGDVIQILPKIGRVNFFRLFIKAGGLQGDLEREFEEFVSYSLDDESNMSSLAARQLYVAALDILRIGPQLGRVLRRREGAFAMGRIDAIATTFNVATHRREPVAFWVRERTYDIPENRVLTEALVRALLLLSVADRDSLEHVCERWLSRFPRSKNLMADLEYVSHGFAVRQYGGPRDYYRKALMLAEVVLGNSGLGFGEGTTVEGDSVLLNTADVYERYLRSVIAGTHGESGYVVSHGREWTISLYSDGSYQMIPDIVISRGGSVTLIADAKYKVPVSSDHYQMYSYLHVMDVETGLLLTPSLDGEEVVARRFSAVDGKTIWEVYLPMSSLPATEAFLGRLGQDFGR